MGMQEVGKLIDKWINDLKFRSEIRKNPESAVQKSGIKLTKEEWNLFKNVDWSLSDEELKARINKGM
ncbi:MAG: hypothetical protein A3B70_01940 [Deltaproteobacteria bacterium RIFCSPHIGHO2_02_FULL_40_11]|nr:MAG: hypothetical protein A3B70_01940 [Deltaproteobacteria bacterium RIFCSPHIGHO2_02_FULL_40_11]